MKKLRRLVVLAMAAYSVWTRLTPEHKQKIKSQLAALRSRGGPSTS